MQSTDVVSGARMCFSEGFASARVSRYRSRDLLQEGFIQVKTVMIWDQWFLVFDGITFISLKQYNTINIPELK